MIGRRRFLSGGLAAAAIWPALGSVRADRFTRDPFQLGVASGSPRAESVVLWTRLVTRPIVPDPMADPFAPLANDLPATLDVAWEVAEDAGFAKPVRAGIAQASAVFAHSVHVEVKGLRPARWYFYRFRCGDAVSPVGRTRTAPAVDAREAPFRFSFASCQQYEQGYYGAYRHLTAGDNDLIIHLGDYIYEKSWGADHVRHHSGGVPTTLDEYRDRYALYKSDPLLQAAHAAAPWLAIWDDHEVANNYANDRSPDMKQPQQFLKRRRAAYQAWYEHMPVPPVAAPAFDAYGIYGAYRFGRTLDLLLLDGRQYRSKAVETPEQGGAPDRTMLGAAQEHWLDEALHRSTARWCVIAQPTLLSERDNVPGPGVGYDLDGWDGYRVARGRLIAGVRRAKVANPVVIGGDLHAFYAADVKADFADEKSQTVATEFVGGSITSDGPSKKSIATALAENPHIKHASNAHGFARIALEPGRATAEFVTIADRHNPDTPASIDRRFALIEGQPGIHRL